MEYAGLRDKIAMITGGSHPCATCDDEGLTADTSSDPAQKSFFDMDGSEV